MQFYIALHYVEAFLLTRKPRTWRRHEDRFIAMHDLPETRAVEVPFERLYKASREARYDGTPFTAADISREIEPLYRAVRLSMRSALGLTA